MMAPAKISLAKVTDESKDFTVVARLDAILPPKLSRTGTVKLQRLLLRDDEGTEINATLFDQDIELFSDVFREGKMYEITNPIINLVREDIRRGGHKYQMVIKARTKIVEVMSGYTEQTTQIVPLNSMLNHIGELRRLDIAAVIVNVSDLRKIPARDKSIEYDARDLIGIDQSLKPTTITVWHARLLEEVSHIVELLDIAPVVHITRVVPSTFAGGCWNTSAYSVLKLNSDVPAVNELQQWVKENRPKIEQLQMHNIAATGESSHQEKHLAHEEEITVPVVSIAEQEEGKTVLLRGKIINVTNPHNLIYSACNVCHKKTATAVGERFSCTEGTMSHMATSEFRFNLHIDFEDESGTINITLFDQLAEKILKKRDDQIVQHSRKDRISFIDEILHTLREKLFDIKIVTYKIGSTNKQLRWKPKSIEEVSS